jgi:integrase
MTEESLLRDQFLAYCQYYAYSKPRVKPLPDRTIARYLRGLQLTEKLIGHDIEHISDDDQLRFISKIMEYAQGTRRVSTQIFQRYLAWGIKNKKLDCSNLLVGREDAIIGADEKVTYKYYSRVKVEAFFEKLYDPKHRIVFGLIYYSGLNTPEILSLNVSSVQPEGILVYRTVLREMQLVPLSLYFSKELQDFVEGRLPDDSLFGVKDEEQSSRFIQSWFKKAQVETGELIGANLRDLRTTGIRHFFDVCNDIELTKQYAGVPPNKAGWLESLVDVSYHHRKKIHKALGNPPGYYNNRERYTDHNSQENEHE